MKQNRVVDIKVGSEWVEKSFADIHTGNIFRLFDDTDRMYPVTTVNGVSEFTAISEVYLINDLQAIDILED